MNSVKKISMNNNIQVAVLNVVLSNANKKAKTSDMVGHDFLLFLAVKDSLCLS